MFLYLGFAEIQFVRYVPNYSACGVDRVSLHMVFGKI